MRKKKAKPFDTEYVSKRLKVLKDKKRKENQRSEIKLEQEQVFRAKQDRAFAQLKNRKIRKLEIKIEFLRMTLEAKTSINFIGSDSETLRISKMRLNNEISKIQSSINIYEKEIKRISREKIRYVDFKKKYSKNEKSRISLTCQNCEVNYETYKSYLDRDIFRYSLCPECRKLKEQAIKQEKLKNKKDYLKKVEKLKETKHKELLKKLESDAKPMNKKIVKA